MRTDPDSAAILAAMIPVYIVAFAFAIVALVAWWKIFVKAGEPGWAAIVPIYSTYTMVKIAGYNPLLFLLFFIPVVNIVFGIMVMIRIGQAFGKSAGWSVVLLIIFNVIGLLILGFGNERYRDPAPALS